MGSAVGGNTAAKQDVNLTLFSPLEVANGMSNYIITYDASAGVNKKVALKNLVHTTYTKVVKTSAADTTTSSTVWSDISDLSISLEQNKTYLIRYYLILESTSATVAANCSLNIGTGHTILGGGFLHTVGTTFGVRTLTGDQTNSSTVTAMPAANTPTLYTMIAVVSTTGTTASVVPSFRSETGSATTITARTYSWGEAIKLN